MTHPTAAARFAPNRVIPPAPPFEGFQAPSSSASQAGGSSAGPSQLHQDEGLRQRSSLSANTASQRTLPSSYSSMAVPHLTPPETADAAPHEVIDLTGILAPGASAASVASAGTSEATQATQANEANPGLSPNWRGAIAWAIAAVVSAGASSTGIFFMERLRKSVQFGRAALSDLPHPYPHADVTRALTPNAGPEPRDPFIVSHYIKYGDPVHENALFELGNHALLRLTQDPNIKPLLPQTANAIQIPMTLLKASKDIYKTKNKSDSIVPASSIASKPGSKALIISAQQVDLLAIKERGLWHGGGSSVHVNVSYKNLSSKLQPLKNQDLYSKFLTPAATFEISASVGILQALQSPHFLKTYNASGGRVPLQTIQNVLISELTAYALAAKPVTGTDPSKSTFNQKDHDYEGLNNTQAFYTALSRQAINYYNLHGDNYFYYQNGTSSNNSAYKYLPALIQEVIKIATPSTAYQALLDTSAAGQEANKKLLQIMPDIYSKNPITYVEPSPEPSPSPSPSPQPPRPGEKPSPSPF